MRLGAQVDDFTVLMTDLEQDLAASNTAAIAEAAQLLKRDLQDDVMSAGLGNRLAKTWRSRVYPGSGVSLDPAGLVWTKAPVLIDAFERGVTIRASRGPWLAIPTKEAGKRAPIGGAPAFGSRGGKTARMTPAGFERRTGMKLRFVYQHNKPSLLVVDAAKRDALGRAAPYRSKGRGSKLYGPKGQTIVVFILVRQVRLRKRLNVDAATERGAARIPGLLVKNWRG